MSEFDDIIDPNEFNEMDDFFRTNPEGFSGEGLRPVSFVLAESILMVQAWQRNEAGGGFRANLRALDQYVQFAPKELSIIAGRPGTGKCLGKGTKVVMYDGALKAVEDVQVGDKLMGPDSTPRRVLSLARGHEMMYWIHQNKGISYRVNESHILSLKRSKNETIHRHGDVHNVSVKDILERPAILGRYKGYKVGVDFPEKGVVLDPYIFGLWLGDGKSKSASIYNTDREVVESLNEYAAARGATVRVGDLNRPCPSYLVSSGKTQAARDSSMQAKLRRMGVLGNKHIPQNYLTNTKQVRLQLLAGLIDSDGHYQRKHNQNGPYEITFTNERLARDLKFLCDSLGYRTSLRSKRAIRQHGLHTEAYRVFFNGNVDEIPVRIARKKACAWQDKVHWQHTGITIEADRVDDYYGFVIGGDHLFLLEDMTVTHNTALAIQLITDAVREDEGNERVAIFSAEMSGSMLLMRLAAAIAEVEISTLRRGLATADQYESVVAALRDLSQMPIWISDKSAPDYAYMKAELEDFQKDYTLAAVVFDFMELLRTRGKNNEERASMAVTALKDIAKEFAVPVIGISQLNRDVEDRADKLPRMSDLRSSGMIEQLADNIILMMRPRYYQDKGIDVDTRGIDKILGPTNVEDPCYFVVAKNRNGATGISRCAFDAQKMMFYDIERKPLADMLTDDSSDTSDDQELESEGA